MIFPYVQEAALSDAQYLERLRKENAAFVNGEVTLMPMISDMLNQTYNPIRHICQGFNLKQKTCSLCDHILPDAEFRSRFKVRGMKLYVCHNCQPIPKSNDPHAPYIVRVPL